MDLSSLTPSYLSASLNFGRDEQGKFELSLAMQPHRARPVDQAATPRPASPPNATGTSIVTAAQAETAAPHDPIPVVAKTTTDATTPVDPSLKNKTVSCALPTAPKQSASDGRLMLVSFSTDDGRIDGYGVNDTAFAPDVEKLAGYTLPVLKWVRNQGALSGYRHAESTKPVAARLLTLPNVVGTATAQGAGDYVMSVAHGAVDFLAVGSGDYATELNLWYHSLNAGFRTQIRSEQPCLSAELPAMNGARSNIQPISISANRRAMSSGNLFVADTRTAIKEFKVNGLSPSSEVGSEVRLGSPGAVAISVALAARLGKPGEASPSGSGWDLEQARIGDTQLVSVEVIVNGRVAASKTIAADGRDQQLDFNLPLQQSSWVAMRIKGAAHSNPVFVLVDNMPVRASKASVDWILRSLLEVYQTASMRWSPSQSASARSAYEYSYSVYQKILSETSAP
jgi:hypothetical protein